MRELLTSLGEVTGGTLIVSGVWSFSHSLGQIVAGVLLALFSWLISR